MNSVKKSVFFLLLLTGIAWYEALAAGLREPEVTLHPDEDSLSVHDTVLLPLPPCRAYAMLTDYEHLPDFIPGLLESHAKRLSAHLVRVRQVGKVMVFIFPMRIESLLDMEETPDRRITFQQVSGDMKFYRGEWRFTGEGAGTRVDYEATLGFHSYVPLQLARSVLRYDVKKKFASIAQEAALRKRAGEIACKAEK